MSTSSSASAPLHKPETQSPPASRPPTVGAFHPPPLSCPSPPPHARFCCLHQVPSGRLHEVSSGWLSEPQLQVSAGVVVLPSYTASPSLSFLSGKHGGDNTDLFRVCAGPLGAHAGKTPAESWQLSLGHHWGCHSLPASLWALRISIPALGAQSSVSDRCPALIFKDCISSEERSPKFSHHISRMSTEPRPLPTC